MVLVSVLSLCCVVFGIGGMWHIPYYDRPSGAGKTSFVQTIVNDSIELETIATLTNNNHEDDSIADEHGCFPSQERDGQLEEIVVFLQVLLVKYSNPLF